MGLEALSRGAGACDFFERGALALTALRGNLAALGAGSEAAVIAGDAWRRLPELMKSRRYELLFLDPPYADSRDWSATGRVPVLLAGLSEAASTGTTIVFHHQASVAAIDSVPGPWVVCDQRVYGSSAVSMLKS
jgi:16S rRNA (guanine966-N2)-methyltransferase